MEERQALCCMCLIRSPVSVPSCSSLSPNARDKRLRVSIRVRFSRFRWIIRDKWPNARRIRMTPRSGEAGAKHTHDSTQQKGSSRFRLRASHASRTGPPSPLALTTPLWVLLYELQSSRVVQRSSESRIKLRPFEQTVKIFFHRCDTK